MKIYLVTLLCSLCSVLVRAQEAGRKVPVAGGTSNGGNWYHSPWLWIAGAAIFILLLVVTTKGEDKKGM